MKQEEKELVLKFASLIEKGSDGMEQITGHYFQDDDLGCCAIGACLKALGYTQESVKSLHFSLLEPFEVWTWPRLPFPSIDDKPFAPDEHNKASLPDVIIYLNDKRGWSFERIVGYLRDCTLDQATIISMKE